MNSDGSNASSYFPARQFFARSSARFWLSVLRVAFNDDPQTAQKSPPSASTARLQRGQKVVRHAPQKVSSAFS
jgi:hypothetical protein